MLWVNIVNVVSLMLQETDPVKAESSVFHSGVLPTLDIAANVLFTMDMLLGMFVLGLYSYFVDHFNQLDFFVVVTG